MEDSTLSTPFLSEAEEAPSTQEKHIYSLDDMIEQFVGDFGWAQLFQAILVSLAWLFDAQQTFITIFTDAEPAWHCTQLGSDSCDSASSNICQLPTDSWAWDSPKHTSTVSEWALRCSGSVIMGLPASSFFAGCLLGGIALSTLADTSLGRKNMLFLSCLVMSSAGLLTVFSTNVWIYSLLRFISGFGRATIGTSTIVLATEMVGKRWRGQVGTFGFVCFTLGFLSLPAMAYVNRGSSWRILYLWTSIPTIFYCMLVHFFVRESPRWLFVQGRKEEAFATLKSIAPTDLRGSTFSFSVVSSKQENWNVNIFSALKILFKRRWAFKRISAVMLASLGLGTVYYGMPLGVGNLSFNLYLSVTLNALSELPASLLIFLVIGRLNRRSGILVLSSISGICSVMCAVASVTWTAVQIWLELLSFFCATTAFGLVLIYTIELFPTCVRNSALSMVRQALVFGGVFSPVLVAAGRENPVLSYGVFGVVIGFCGLFVLCLPETRGLTLCDTMEEEERKCTMPGAEEA